MGSPTLRGLAQAALLTLSSVLPVANAQGYSIESDDAIRESARTLAYDMMLFYEGNRTGKTPGILPGPPADGTGDYYWWQGGAMMATFIEYWHLTGDSSYNEVVKQGVSHQAGEDKDYQPYNFTASLGNDDQGFWGMTVMTAAELKFPDPPEDQPQWLALAQAVWTTQADPLRHDDSCGGGMRWQIPSTNVGYDYKNTIANACFFNIGSRLARYTSNETYLQYAEETWDWLWAVNYIDHENWRVYDGAHVPNNCTQVDKTTYSYNIGVLLQGCAFLYNHTEDAKWLDRADKLSDRLLEDFFPDGIAYEIACEREQGKCSADMIMFKGFVHRWLASVTQMIPAYKDKILPILRTSAEAAAKQCTGGASGRICGFYWKGGVYVDPAVDDTTGAGEALDVLAAVQSLLIESADPPVTNTTGGTSRGDYNAGRDVTGPRVFEPITMADRAGAGIITVIILGCSLAAWGWMSK